MALGNSSIKLLRKIIKRRNRPRRKLDAKRIKGEDRPKYFRSPPPPRSRKLTSAEYDKIREIILRLNCSYEKARRHLVKMERKGYPLGHI